MIENEENWPAFTVVVPAYNARATLTSCMQSVLAQTVVDLELLVVDDGSTDDTGAIAQSSGDPRVRVIHKPNGGLSSARNAGTAAARAELTCYLDADDLLLPSYLQIVGEAFASDPGVDFVYTDAWTFDDRTRRVRKTTTAHYQRPPRPAPATAPALLGELLRRNFIPVPVAVRTQVIVDGGLFDERMTSCEDWDMWVRLAATGHRATEAPGPLGLRREHDANMSSNVLRMVENGIYLFEKLLRETPLTDEAQAQATRTLAHLTRERRILLGEDRVGQFLRRRRTGLGRTRRAVGLGARWYKTPPEPVASAFADLSAV